MKKWRLISIVGLFAVGVFESGCGKSVRIGMDEGSSFPYCSGNQVVRWQFVQPDLVESRVVDILFVADTSRSLQDKRSMIAATLPSFISQLAPDTDFRVAVMLAHGGASKYSGRLYSAGPDLPVLKSTESSISKIQSTLKSNLGQVIQDSDEANGEALLYSLSRSLQSDRVIEIQNQGFYRSDAALSVVFISDENDICFRPELNGLTSFPDFVPNFGNIEAVAYAKYCGKDGYERSHFVDRVSSQLSLFKRDRPLTLAAISHIDPLKVPRGGEESIGHGIIDVVRKSLGGVLIDITESDFEAGLAQIGGSVSTSLELLTRFKLEGALVLPETIQTQVDQKVVRSAYDSTTESVQIQLQDAGRKRSLIDVTACRAN